MEKLLYGYLFTIITFIDLFLAYRCFKKQSAKGVPLGCCISCTAVISFLYMLCIMTENHQVMSISSSIYFCFIDLMLLFFLDFFSAFTASPTFPAFHGRIVRVLRIWAFFDSIVLLTNPFHNRAIGYTLEKSGEGSVSVWTFEPHFLYRLHLLLCYLLIVYSLFVLIRKMLSVPSLYRGIYIRVAAFTLLIVALNAGFLLQKFYHNIDYSIIFYTLLAFGMYWNTFESRNRSLLNRTRQEIIEHAKQPILLFDYDNQLILSNQSAKKLFPFIANRNGNLDIHDFISSLGLKEQVPDLKQDIQFYWTSQDSGHTSYICSLMALKNKSGKPVAWMFLFTSNLMEIDPLTDFQSQQYFEQHRAEISSGHPKPMGIVVCDLNRLSLLNSTIGRKGGDEALSLQANAMKMYLPASSVFVRLNDAILGAVCYGLDRNALKERMKAISKELLSYSNFPFRLTIDFAICMAEDGVDAAGMTRKAISILRTRKLLDRESDRSSAIDSLCQMLMECDPETEKHVQRTRTLGENLAFRIGLSDYERDQLSLLCLFHDIGKVGIPLHILNKPGPLTDSEWEILKSHVQKGYRIAKATPELNIVADPILHHHEFWNGGGYPDHLQHESIPLLARIISVVDAYDAMVTDRVYRKGRSKKEACEELKRCAGTQFDPYIVDAFLQIHYPEMASEADAKIAGNRALMSLRRLEESIRLDPMTGLLNRTAFQNECQQQLFDENSRFLLMMIDVDNFKTFNDTFGHPNGDILLKKLAEALEKCAKNDGLAGRLGGDEFCCMLCLEPDISPEGIYKKASLIFEEICRNIADLPASPTISAGAVCSSHCSITFQELYTAADNELYAAKRRGKNQFSLRTKEETA